MRILAALLALLVTMVAACADEPVSVDAHSCQAFVPLSALKDRLSGQAVVSYRILGDGSVADPVIILSSGHPELDEAALVCARTWNTSRPGAKTGHGTALLGLAGKPHVCLIDAASVQRLGSGVARVRFTVTANGHVENSAIAATSGNADIDAASLQCVLNWRYLPAVKNYVPIAVPWIAEIVWNTERTPPVLADFRSCIRAVPLTREDLSGIDGVTGVSFATVYNAIYEMRLTHSSGSPKLDAAALKCASTPPTHEVYETVTVGVPVGHRMTEQIDWRQMLLERH